jgi:hypothetical protein
MCHQCNTGQPHICIASGGVYVSGKGPEFHSATYREEIPKGGVIEMVADDSCDDEEDGSPDPLPQPASGAAGISSQPSLTCLPALTCWESVARVD